MRLQSSKITAPLLLLVLIVTPILYGVGSLFFSGQASADYLGTRFLEMSDSKAGATGVTYNVSFTTTTPGTVGSVEIEFCSNSTFITDPCTAPIGLSASAATLASQSGMTGFTISGASTANNIILTRAPAAAGAVTADYVFNNMTNPTNEGSYYVRVQTFQTNDASGPNTDHAGIAIAILPAINVNLTVPPYLLFCVGLTISGTDCNTVAGDFIELGNFSTSKTSSGQSQMVVATNGKTGYSITVNGSTLESGNNTLPPIAAQTAALPGVSQFGINLRANSNPSVGANPSGPGTGTPAALFNTPNLYHYADGDAVVSKAIPEDLRKFTVSYIVDVNQNQAVGIYASTFTYVATANF